MKQRFPGESITTSEFVPTDLTRLFEDIDRHNLEHGLGARWGKILSGSLLKALEGSEANFGEVTKGVVEESQNSSHSGLTFLNASHAKILGAFGLSLIHKPSPDPEKSSSEEVLLVVTDPEKLFSGIKSLSKMPGDTKEKFVSGLVQNLERQIKTIDFTNLQQIDARLLQGLPEIVETLRGLTPDTSRNQLELYARFATEERLANYMKVEHEGLWHAPGEGFGPADWVKDITPENLDKKWRHALAVLAAQERIGEEGVAPELREHLLTCISVAAEWLPGSSWSEETKKQMKDILIKYSKELVAGYVN